MIGEEQVGDAQDETVQAKRIELFALSMKRFEVWRKLLPLAVNKTSMWDELRNSCGQVFLSRFCIRSLSLTLS